MKYLVFLTLTVFAFGQTSLLNATNKDVAVVLDGKNVKLVASSGMFFNAKQVVIDGLVVDANKSFIVTENGIKEDNNETL